MPGGRPRKSLRLLEASGAVDKNPQRFADREVEPIVSQPLGPPPDEWVAAASTSPENRKLVKAWEELSSYIAYLPADTLTAADRAMMKIACRLHVKVESTYAKPGDFTHYLRALNELGLSQAGRAKRAGPAPRGNDPDGDFGDFVRKPARRSA
jgi:hypothetical protein